MSTPICECLFSVANRIRNNKRNNGNDNDKNSNNNTHDELNNIINSTPEDPCDAIFQLKKLILTKGLPRDISNEMRSKTWKLLLGIPYFDVDEYLNKGKNATEKMKEKIREDAFRTFKGNQSFWTRVDDSCDTMIRILDAVSYDCGYVQGMNVLLAPFLYLMPELDSYYCYRSLISDHCPTYIEKNVEGAKLGCSLFIECFSILDKELYDHIQNVSQHYKSDILSVLPLPYVFTLLANKKPLEEALRIWDSIFAFGVHLNIIVMVVYFMLVRNDLLKEKSAYKVKCKMEEPELDSEVLVHCALAMVQFLPAEFLDRLARHPLLLN